MQTCQCTRGAISDFESSSCLGHHSQTENRTLTIRATLKISVAIRPLRRWKPASDRVPYSIVVGCPTPALIWIMRSAEHIQHPAELRRFLTLIQRSNLPAR